MPTLRILSDDVEKLRYPLSAHIKEVRSFFHNGATGSARC